MNWATVSRSSPEHPGVYRIELDGALAYIGQSGRVINRLCSQGIIPGGVCHREGRYKGFAFREVSVSSIVIADTPERLAMEKSLIEQLRPALCVLFNPENRTHKMNRHPELQSY